MRKENKYIAVFLVAFFAYFYYTALSFPPRSALYPKILIVTGILLSILMFIQAYFGKGSNDEGVKIEKKELKLLCLSAAIMVIYILLIRQLGYAVSTFIYMLIQMWILVPGKKLLYLTVALSSTAVLYVVFGMLLRIWLPKGMFF